MHGRIHNFLVQINWLTASCLGFVFGVAVASFFVVHQIVILIIVSVTPFIAVVFYKNKRIRIPILMLLFFVAGFLRFNLGSDIPKDSKQYYESRQEVQVFSELRNKLSQGLDNALLAPHSSLYKAMVLGDESDITYKLRQDLSRTGLIHIVSVSGMHIAVLGLILFWILTQFISRRYAVVISFGILTFYILVIGAPIPAIRAGIMAGALMIAQFIGRPNSILRALLYAATVMIVMNPVIIRFDIGFQLSFLAVLGILVFMKPLDRLFQKIPLLFIRNPVTKDRKIATYLTENKFTAFSLLAVTISAQALTFPLTIYYFNIFSYVAPITNILVALTLPLVLILGFIAAIFGALNFLPVVFAAPAWLLSSYIWWVVSVFSF